jgi:hypothetical protein
VNHFIVSFEGVELTDAQSARIQSAIEATAKKEFEALPITYLPTGPGPGHHGGRGPSNPGAPGNTSPSKPGGNPGTGPIEGTGNPIGKRPFPITLPVSYDPHSKTWKAA